MTRRNISIPDDLDARARDAGLNVSALARGAIVAELDRRSRMEALDAWLDELDEQHGRPSARSVAAAQRWAAEMTMVVPVVDPPDTTVRAVGPGKERTGASGGRSARGKRAAS